MCLSGILGSYSNNSQSKCDFEILSVLNIMQESTEEMCYFSV